jgi:Trk K+ transport system NAD-binding subunit
LNGLNIPSILVERDPDKLEGLQGKALLGDAEDPATMEHAGLERALMVVTTLRIAGTNELMAYLCRQAGVPCVVHAFDGSLVEPLRSLGVEYLLDSKKFTAQAMIERLRETGVLER